RRDPAGRSSIGMRLCAIDVGSNTVRLLVVDVVGPETWKIVDARQTVTRLGEGLAAAGALGDAPMARTLAVVSDYVARAERLAAGPARARAAPANPRRAPRSSRGHRRDGDDARGTRP